MHACGIPFVREPELVVRYRGVVVGLHKPDFIADGKIVLELKCVSRLEEVFTSQVLTYHLTKLELGLLVNFNASYLKYGGISRVALSNGVASSTYDLDLCASATPRPVADANEATSEKVLPPTA
jgi:GxxExxY protein